MIQEEQIFCSVIRTGPTGLSLNSSFQQRDSELYKRELGAAILQTAQVAPEGLLVFFPSYWVMEQCIAVWKAKLPAEKKSLYDQIAAAKSPVLEPKAKGELASVS